MRRIWIALVVALVVPAEASAHAVISIGGGELLYVSEDVGSASRLRIDANLATVNVYDPGAVGGMQAPGSCRPGRVDDRGLAVEYACPATGVGLIRLDVAGDEDLAEVTGPFEQHATLGWGADDLRTGDARATVRADDGNDVVTTGAGNDDVHGGPGADTIATGAGDDAVEAADGERDDVRCGDGADRVHADTTDAVAGDCEAVERIVVAPPATPGAGDTTAPRLKVRARRTQRARSRRIVVAAAPSEPGIVSASGYVSAGPLRLGLRPVHRRVAAGGRSTRLVLKLTRRQAARVRRAGGGWARLRVAATDAAGNESPPRRMRLRLVP